MARTERSQLLRSLRVTGEALTRRGQSSPITVVVAGGSAGLLAGMFRSSRVTGDCDLIWQGDEATWSMLAAAAEETAELLGLGRVEVFPPLSSFLRDSDGGEAQKKALKDWLQSAPLTPPVVLVTHQVNLTALTGAMPKSSELFVVKRLPEGGFEVLGSIEP